MKFLRQDYRNYKRLKRKWRKPKGMHSKLRVGKRGSGTLVKIGYKKRKAEAPVLVKDLKSLDDMKGKAIIISSQLGSKKTIAIAEKANKAGIKILNMKKVKKAKRKEKLLETKKLEKKPSKEEKKHEEKKESEEKSGKEKKEELKDTTLVKEEKKKEEGRAHDF
jgi:large subunit ribosomal protein L32e